MVTPRCGCRTFCGDLDAAEDHRLAVCKALPRLRESAVDAVADAEEEHDACDCVSREAVIEALTDHYIHNTVCSDFKKAIEVIERTFPSKSGVEVDRLT